MFHLRSNFPPKFIVKRYNNCTNEQECVEACIYGVHVVDENGQIAEPISERCRGCFLCVLACPKGAISVELNPEFKKLGDSYFTPERIETIYFEAETGRVPVSGTGYKGPFAGRGFDSIWFDFSEIVRPTRDGIYGREYISTAVDLGREPPYLTFSNGNLTCNPPTIIEIPIPMILDTPAYTPTIENLQLAVVKAAHKLETFAIVNVENYTEKLLPYSSNIIPRMKLDNVEKFKDLIKISRIIEVNIENESIGEDEVKHLIEYVKNINPSTLISFRFIYNREAKEKAYILTRSGVDIIHMYTDDKAVRDKPDLIVNAIRQIHLYLVSKKVRDEITFISSGGIAEVSHVPKSIALGADAVCIGLPYQIALGCKVCYGGKHSEDRPLRVEKEDIEWAMQRIINLIGSWRDQLIEVLGGTGMRDARRLRGEMGRTMTYKVLEL